MPEASRQLLLNLLFKTASSAGRGQRPKRYLGEWQLSLARRLFNYQSPAYYQRG